MYLEDSDLLMLENLTCINKDTQDLIKGLKPISSYHSLRDYLNVFDDKALMTLEAQGDTSVTSGDCSGSELAAMLRYMKGSSLLNNLLITDAPVNKNNLTMALCYEDPDDPKHAIVTFHGTLDHEEWKDNILGLYQSDTAAQLEALTYINSLPYSNLTVVGHSKGGNKAQYVSIRSDKVKRGVSFDGQGFSRDFIDKYPNEIKQNASKVKNYSLSTDFVHPLLFPLPGVTQLYVDGGSDVKTILERHSPNSFFVYYVDSNQKTQIVCNPDGIPYFPMTEESDSVKIIHEFTNFIQNTASKEDEKIIGDFIGDLLYIEFDSTVSMEQRRIHILERLFRDPKEIATLLAYLLKYIETYHLINKDITFLLQVLGLNEFNHLLRLTPKDMEEVFKLLYLKQAGWENNLLIFQTLLLIQPFTAFGLNLFTFWEEFKDTFLSLKEIDPELARKDATLDIETLNIEMEDGITSFLTQWKDYTKEEWFKTLCLGEFENEINKYGTLS